MPAGDYLSDEHVANLMTKDARESTIKYSAYGLQPLLPKRPTTNAPKANTRFLKNIIRETDTHNAALRAKELDEARSRLKRLQKKETSPKVLSEHRRYYDERQDSDYSRHSKRRRLESDEALEEQRHRTQKRYSSHKSNKQDSEGRDSTRSTRHHRHRTPDEEESNSDQGQHHRRAHHRRRHHRDRSHSRDQSISKNRSKYPEHNRRSRSPDTDRDRHHRKSRRRKHHSRSSSADTIPPDRKRQALSTKTRIPPAQEDTPTIPDLDSDPLESIVGPAPPPPAAVSKPRPRGRGTHTSTSAMDAHFSSTYDPSADVHPNSDSENDWDQAFEALRDRQRWKQQGAERLRSAGFTEEEVGKWERGGEKREEDVRWKGRGEGREWDRGKVVDGEGMVDTRPEWGRLKGT